MAAVAVILVLIVWHFRGSAEWQEFRWRHVWSLLTHANPGWLLAATVASYLSYLLRAYRWKFFLDPIKKSSLRVLFVAQVLGFSAIYLIGRLGEAVRPAYIARWERVTIVSQVAILLLERIYDGVAITVLLGLALYFEPIRPRGAHAALALHRMHQGAAGILILAAALVAALVLFRHYSETLIPWTAARLRFLPRRAGSLLNRLLLSFAEGLDVVQNWRDLAASGLCTIILWTLNTSTLWLVCRSLGGPLEDLSWRVAAVALFSAAAGLVLQLPGVGGGYQLGVLLALTQIFHVGATAATSAALLAWIVLLVPCVALGLALVAYEGLSFRKLEALAAAERAALGRGAVRGPG